MVGIIIVKSQQHCFRFLQVAEIDFQTRQSDVDLPGSLPICDRRLIVVSGLVQLPGFFIQVSKSEIELGRFGLPLVEFFEDSNSP